MVSNYFLSTPYIYERFKKPLDAKGTADSMYFNVEIDAFNGIFCLVLHYF